MNRYLSSFVLSLFIYGSLFATTMFFIKDQSLSKSSKEPSKDIHRVKISLVEPTKEVKQKPKEQTIKKQKPQEKIIKKIAKQTPKPKPSKKIVKKEEPKKIKPKKIAKKVEKKEKLVKKETPKTQNTVPKKVASKTIKKDKNIEAKKIKELQDKYFALISETINKNKSYPRRAVLRNLQDDIKVEFIISPLGELISFDIKKGKKIFYKSARKAIEKSFPMTPPRGVLSSNTKVKLTLAYRLN